MSLLELEAPAVCRRKHGIAIDRDEHAMPIESRQRIGAGKIHGLDLEALGLIGPNELAQAVLPCLLERARHHDAALANGIIVIGGVIEQTEALVCR